MMSVAIALVVLTVAVVVAPLFLPAANRVLGRGVESRDPLDRWQHEKDRLTGQLRDNDIALAEGRIDGATHGRNNQHLAAEAEAAVVALRRARTTFADADADADTAAPRLPSRAASVLTAVAVAGAAFGVSAVASMSDIDTRRSPHADGSIPLDAAAAPVADGMPLGADGAPDIGAMVARLEGRVAEGDASADDYRMLLRSYDVLGRSAEAMDLLATAAERFPQDTEFELAWLRQTITSPDGPPADELLRRTDRVLAAEPDLAEAHWYRALLLLRQERTGDARTELQWLAIRLAPEHPAHGRVQQLLAETAGSTQQGE